jgi:hypothetical protein
MDDLEQPTHFLILILPMIGLVNLISLISIPIIASSQRGVWWKWLLLTMGIGAFAWIPLIAFLNQRKK